MLTPVNKILFQSYISMLMNIISRCQSNYPNIEMDLEFVILNLLTSQKNYTHYDINLSTMEISVFNFLSYPGILKLYVYTLVYKINQIKKTIENIYRTNPKLKGFLLINCVLCDELQHTNTVLNSNRDQSLLLSI